MNFKFSRHFNNRIDKIITFFILCFCAILLILMSTVFKLEIKPVHKSEVKEILSKIPIEYEVKNIDDDTYNILVTINSDNGIESIEYINDLGQNVILNCKKQLTIGIDYIVKENIEYNFIVKRVGEAPKVEKIFIEKEEIQDGTEQYPYIIKTPEQLQNINLKLSAYYKLGKDIDLSGKTWEIIGSEGNPFTGELNGNGKKIKNLTINKDVNNVGLFGYSTGSLKNVKLENVNVTGKDNVGGLVRI